MKIKNRDVSYDFVENLPAATHKKPKKTNMFFRTLLKCVSYPDLKKTHFSYKSVDMDRLAPDEPCLYLMNHSSFIDLKIASTILYPRPFNIVCTSDGFIGKEWLMKNLGCIPTKKFVTDVSLVRDMLYCVNTLKTSILLYPEASYSFDGLATPLPDSIGRFIKKLNVPVSMIRTYGAFSRDPLYNMLQLRNVKVGAEIKYILSKEDIQNKSCEEINEIINELFTFDNFKWQQENHILIDEPFRADGLNRVLYKCPECNTEGKMEGDGIIVKCNNCNKEWELTEEGFLKSVNGTDRFTHVPDWYAWERECVKKSIEDGTYSLDIPVRISIMRDTKCLYNVGEGRLVHNKEGFHLTGCDGKLDYKQSPVASYGLYADYYWYEIGDMICIGTQNELYYCFPLTKDDIVAKTRLATEELYKIVKKQK